MALYTAEYERARAALTPCARREVLIRKQSVYEAHARRRDEFRITRAC